MTDLEEASFAKLCFWQESNYLKTNYKYPRKAGHGPSGSVETPRLKRQRRN